MILHSEMNLLCLHSRVVPCVFYMNIVIFIYAYVLIFWPSVTWWYMPLFQLIFSSTHSFCIYLASMAAIISWHLQELDTHEGDVQVCSTHSLSSYPHLPLTLQPTPSPFRHFRDWLCFELRKRQPVWHSQLLRHLLRHAWLVTLLLFCFFYRSVKHGPLCSLVWLNYVQLCLLMW